VGRTMGNRTSLLVLFACALLSTAWCHHAEGTSKVNAATYRLPEAFDVIVKTAAKVQVKGKEINETSDYYMLSTAVRHLERMDITAATRALAEDLRGIIARWRGPTATETLRTALLRVLQYAGRRCDVVSPLPKSRRDLASPGGSPAAARAVPVVQDRAQDCRDQFKACFPQARRVGETLHQLGPRTDERACAACDSREPCPWASSRS